ncbi:hypothetical protein BCR43DRAFT_487510 [Syncephalastrum racemosum]|uniref:Uncharacterized protein n=1 Tax=Syncephalastrum racemosum TaxID=13706 RepID=A0A1X2HSB0_SYNRA|nr:hypothetical protein BCR43DRAFT_487510 [Syncephalastrum racemosum]
MTPHPPVFYFSFQAISYITFLLCSTVLGSCPEISFAFRITLQNSAQRWRLPKKSSLRLYSRALIVSVCSNGTGIMYYRRPFACKRAFHSDPGKAKARRLPRATDYQVCIKTN